MPAATTHIEFARDVREALEEKARDRIKNIPVFLLGSQGPDLFFFSKLIVLPGSLYPLGTKMHNEKVREILTEMEHFSRFSETLYSYFCGYLCHYALDSSAHPLINYYSMQEAEETGISETEAHFRNEGTIDVHVLRNKNRPVSSYSVYKDLAVDQADAETLAAMYHILFQEVLQEEVPARDILEAIHGIRRLTKWLRPGNPLKYRFVYRTESLLKAPHLITGMMLDGKQNAPSAVLNETHELHSVPGQQGVSDSRSFDEIYSSSIRKAKDLIEDFSPAKILLDFRGWTITE